MLNFKRGIVLKIYSFPSAKLGGRGTKENYVLLNVRGMAGERPLVGGRP